MPLPDVIIKAAFNQTRQATVVLDTHGIPVLWNNAFEKLFSIVAGFVPTRFAVPLFEWLEEQDSQNISYYMTEVSLGHQDQAVIQVNMRQHDGKRLWLSITLSPLFTGTALNEVINKDAERWLLCSFLDITEQKLHENNLVVAKEEAEKATQTKSNFLANMSHEIRTPIQTILGITELLEETKPDKEQLDYIKSVRFSADVLLCLINDILDFSKIEAGKMEMNMTNFELRPILRQSVDLIILEAHKKKLEVIVDIDESLPQKIYADSGRIRQIVVNLFKNAVKFTASGSITVAAKKTFVDGSPFVSIYIADTGLGVSKEFAKKLFTPFSQGSAGTIAQGGTGLGLAISRSFVEAMKGNIWYKANEGGGSIFGFSIPLTLPIVSPEKMMFTSSIKTLVLDDNATSMSHTVKMVRSFGLEVYGTTSGQVALDMIRNAAKSNDAFKLCLVDQNMQGMDGWHFAAEVNADKEINDINMILLVPEGVIGADTKMKLLHWFNAYTSKPIYRSVLFDVINKTFYESLDLPLLDDANSIDFEHQEKSLLLKSSCLEKDTLEELLPVETTENVPSENNLGLNILLAEDHPVNQEVFSMHLKRLGCNIEIANNGLEALEKVETGKFDIILMDIFMPVMDGYEASRILRSKHFKKPIIAITASAQKDEHEKCLSSGMNDVLVKPFKRIELFNILEFWKSYSEKTDKVSAKQIEANKSASAKIDLSLFDFQSLVDTFFGNKEKVKDLIKRFINKTESQIESFDTVILQEDHDEIRNIAHSIKGASWNLCINKLGNCAMNLEKAAYEDLCKIKPLLEKMKEAFIEFKNYAKIIENE